MDFRSNRARAGAPPPVGPGETRIRQAGDAGDHLLSLGPRLLLRQDHQPGCATVRLWPTAHCFKRGQRIGIQVSSGAFPRYARNPGTGEPHATILRAANQAVYHDPAHPRQ